MVGKVPTVNTPRNRFNSQSAAALSPTPRLRNKSVASQYTMSAIPAQRRTEEVAQLAVRCLAHLIRPPFMVGNALQLIRDIAAMQS
jgi:hypothetical protein